MRYLNNLLSISILALILSTQLNLITGAQTDISPRPLTLGKNIERRLSDKEIQVYAIATTSGQYNRVLVRRLNIPLAITLSAPDGKRLTQGQCVSLLPCVYTWLSAAAGSYRLEIKPLRAGLAKGWYEVQLVEQRPAHASDQTRIRAATALMEGDKLQFLGASDKAEEQYKSAFASFQSVGDQWSAALTLMSHARIYFKSDTSQQAHELFAQSLTLWRALGDHKMEAQTFVDLGNLSNLIGETKAALEQYQQALTLQRAIGDRWGEAASLSHLADLYASLDDPQQSLVYRNQSYQLYLASGETGGAAFELNSLGTFYYSIGDYERAIEYTRQTIPLWQDAGDERSEAGMLKNIGYMYQLMGEPAKAIEFYTRGLTLTHAKNFTGMESGFLAILGEAYRDLNEPQKALDYFQQALALRQKLGNRHTTFLSHCLLANAFEKAGNHAQARDHLKQATALWPTMDDNATKEFGLRLLGETYVGIGAYDEARPYFERLLAMARARDSRSVEAAALVHLAEVAAAREPLDEARAQMETALKLHESLRGKLPSDELRSSYFPKVKRHYQLYLDILMRLHRAHPAAGYDAAALQANERTRARTLLEMLHEARLDIRRGIEPTLLERDRSLRQQLNTKAAARSRLPAKATTEFAAATADINALEREYELLQAQIRTTSPQYAALTAPQPLSVSEIQQALDADTLLLEFALGKESSYLWAVTSTSLASYELPRRAEIEAAAKRVYSLLTARQPVRGETAQQYRDRVAQAEAAYDKAAAELSRMILSPAAALLPGKRLLIVADGALQYVPFAALPEPKDERGTMNAEKGKPHRSSFIPHPLIVHHEIINLPSASVLTVLRQAAQDRKPAARAIAVIADPVFEATDPRLKPPRAKQPPIDSLAAQNLERALRDVAGERGALSRLPFTRAEANAIRALVPGALTALDFKASKTLATSPELRQYRVVHFATHGVLDATHPALSGLVLSLVNERGEAQDGFLRLHEIYNLDLPADLVVLSACQTALGREVWGEGMIGLTRGFMHAGAQRVLASLWKVDDSTTADVMQRFYRALLKEGKTPAAALRATQLEMHKQPQWQSPYFWAAFVLQGEYR